jgi:hypothetical protein
MRKQSDKENHMDLALILFPMFTILGLGAWSLNK